MTPITTHAANTPTDRGDTVATTSSRSSHRRVVTLLSTAATAGLIVSTGLWGTPPALAQETGEQRCTRQTAEYNAAMSTAWHAAHPGQTPGAGAWPPFICQDLPTPPAPGEDAGNTTGGDTGGGLHDGRTHHYEGFDDSENHYQQDMTLGNPQTGVADRVNGRTPSTTAPGALDTARSNVPVVPRWATPRTETIPTGDGGGTRDVQVVDSDAGPVILDDTGRATGQILDPGAAGGISTIEGLAGVDVLAQRDGEHDHGSATTSTAPSASATPGSPTSGSAVPIVPGEIGQHTDDADNSGTTGGGVRFDPLDPTSPIGPGGLGVLAAAAGGVGAVLHRKRRRDGSARADIDWGGGRHQSLIVMEGPESPRTHRFAMDVPDGGQMVKNPDGSVDVLDADGTVVEHVKAPWAYDASGRAVPTYYEVDNETGELIQVVDPEHTTTLPIIADPDAQEIAYDSPRDGSGTPPQAPEGYVYTPQDVCTPEYPDGYWQLTPDPEAQPSTGVGIVDTTGHEEGQPWEQDLGGGETATHTIVPDTGGQSVNTHIDRDNGTYADIHSTQNEQGGANVWANENTGEASYLETDPINDTSYAEHYDEAPVPEYTPAADITSEGNWDNSQGTVYATNDDGTQSVGDYQRVDDNRYDMEVQNPDQTTSQVASTQREDAGVSTRVTDDAGSRVSTDGETVVPLDTRGNDISQTDTPDPATGQFYNPDSGEWVNGAVIEGVDTPVYRTDDGNLVWGMNNDDGGTDWVTMKPNGESAVVRELDWNTDGSPNIVNQDPFVSSGAGNSAVDGTAVAGAGSQPSGRPEAATQAVNALTTGMIDGTVEGLTGPGTASGVLARTAEGMSRGAASASFGVVLGTAMNMSDGMGATEAIATNAAGGAAGWLAGAGTAAMIGAAGGSAVPGLGTVVGFAVGAAVGYLTTNGLQSLWDD